MKNKKKKYPKTEFKIEQKIVYPLHGVGEIKDIQEKHFKGEMILYYIIYIKVLDMTFMIPVDKAHELGIRAIVNAKTSRKALELISREYEPVPTDWKLRYQMNLDFLKKGSIMDIATVVCLLYNRSKVKELPILERKLYDNALNFFTDELCFSLGKGKKEIEELIFNIMDKTKSKVEAN